mmetsp:Transcript_24911/g.44366  ORF Transcript_24911/g.44366 Transcript_24911/m.44366 type:complete len:242 (+) Transcript_24911:912-1637(+)
MFPWLRAKPSRAIGLRIHRARVLVRKLWEAEMPYASTASKTYFEDVLPPFSTIVFGKDDHVFVASERLHPCLDRKWLTARKLEISAVHQLEVILFVMNELQSTARRVALSTGSHTAMHRLRVLKRLFDRSFQVPLVWGLHPTEAVQKGSHFVRSHKPIRVLVDVGRQQRRVPVRQVHPARCGAYDEILRDEAPRDASCLVIVLAPKELGVVDDIAQVTASPARHVAVQFVVPALTHPLHDD